MIDNIREWVKQNPVRGNLSIFTGVMGLVYTLAVFKGYQDYKRIIEGMDADKVHNACFPTVADAECYDMEITSKGAGTTADNGATKPNTNTPTVKFEDTIEEFIGVLEPLGLLLVYDIRVGIMSTMNAIEVER